MKTALFILLSLLSLLSLNEAKNYTYYYQNNVPSDTGNLGFFAPECCSPYLGFLDEGAIQRFNCNKKLTHDDYFLFVAFIDMFPGFMDYFCIPDHHSNRNHHNISSCIVL